MSTPLILVTNDDGYDAPGLQALADAISPLGDVAIVAPDRERSAVGRSISLGRPLRAKPRGERRWAVDGTPVDCVYLAVHTLLDRRPDLVVSGINRGPNLADDTGYSGTVAGACEGAIVGIPAVAFSLVCWNPTTYAPAAAFAASVAAFVLTNSMPRRTVLNVNIPDTGDDPVPGYRWAVGGERDYGHVVDVRHDPRGVPYYWLGGKRLGHTPVHGSDCEAIEAGFAALTPLDLDLTDHRVLADLRESDLPGYSRR